MRPGPVATAPISRPTGFARIRTWRVFFALTSLEAAGAVLWWRRHRRWGTGFVNRVIDPRIVRWRMDERSRGEIALIEHVGRTTGILRRTPVHPVPTETGFRIIVPLASDSQWARNVLAAGRCRLKIGDVIHDLDEPRLVSPCSVAEIVWVGRIAMSWLGFRYLLLRDARRGKQASDPTEG